MSEQKLSVGDRAIYNRGDALFAGQLTAQYADGRFAFLFSKDGQVHRIAPKHLTKVQINNEV